MPSQNRPIIQLNRPLILSFHYPSARFDSFLKWAIPIILVQYIIQFIFGEIFRVNIWQNMQMAENVGSDPIVYSPLNPLAEELGLVLSDTGDTGDFLLFDSCTGEEDGLDFFPFVLRFRVGETRLNCLVALKGRGPVEGDASLLTPYPVLLDILCMSTLHLTESRV